MKLSTAAVKSSGALKSLRVSASVGGLVRARITAMAGAEARRKPADVKTIERVVRVKSWRKRLWRAVEPGDSTKGFVKTSYQNHAEETSCTPILVAYERHCED